MVKNKIKRLKLLWIIKPQKHDQYETFLLQFTNKECQKKNQSFFSILGREIA